MIIFRRERTMTAVYLILSMIFALALIIPWYRIYKFEHMNIVANKAYVWQELLNHPKTALIFGFLTIAWIILSIMTFVRYRRVVNYFGGYFGSILGRFILILEYLGFIALILVLLFAL